MQCEGWVQINCEFSCHAKGLDEVVVATIMREVLKALDYVHKQGGIHRDIKVGSLISGFSLVLPYLWVFSFPWAEERGVILFPATTQAGNILVDKDGWVYLADFGVATSLERNGSWGHDKSNRMTFVGTPCWMAPEVMEQTAGWVV